MILSFRFYFTIPKQVWAAVLLGLGSLFSFAQSSQVEKFLSELRSEKEDSSRVITLNDLAWELKGSNPDSAIILSKQALELSEKLRSSPYEAVTRAGLKGQARSLHQLGVFNRVKGNYTLALEYSFKSLEIRESLNDKNGISATIGNIGSIYWNKGDFPKALEYYLKALKSAQELGDKNRAAVTLGNIGSVYYSMGDQTKALDYYLKALKIDEEIGNKQAEANTLGNIGAFFNDQGDILQALDYYSRALKIMNELGNKNGIADQLGNIGTLFISQNKLDAADTCLQKALKLSLELGTLEGIKKSCESLSELNAKRENWKTSLSYYKHYIAVRDSISDEENTQRLIHEKMNCEFEKSEQVTKLEEEKKEAMKRVIFYAELICTFLTLLLVIAIFLLYRGKKRMKGRS